MSDDALLLVGFADQHSPVRQGQQRRTVNKRRRHDMRARVKKPRVLRERRAA